MEREEEIELREIFMLLRRQYKLITIIPLIAMLASAVISYYIIKPTYQAQTTLIVNMKITATDLVLDSNAIKFSRELVPTYKELVSSRKITDKVVEIVKKETGVKSVSSQASVQAVGTTELMRITVEDKDPKMAALYANVLARVFAEDVPTIVNIDNVKIIDEAKVPSAPVKPNKKRNILIAGIIGLMVAVGLAFIIEILDNTYKRSEDIKRELDLPVLGVIPKHSEKYRVV